MKFTSSTVTAFCLSVGSAAAFSQSASPAFVLGSAFVSTGRNSGFAGPVVHTPGCSCSFCQGSATQLFMSETLEAEAAEVPAEVEALDGIEGDEEAHNADRPARSSLKKKRKGKALSELSVGETVKAKVKTITNYGAFLDIGATTDGLLHISNLSAGFVSNVNDILKEGQELEVRITNIDEAKGQVGLTLLTEAEEEAAAQPRQPREQRKQQDRGGQGGNRRDDSQVVAALAAKRWDSEMFVEGEVVSTVDFGAFVRLDVSLLNPEVEGEMDGLVHISALTKGRADSVTSVVKVGDKVQVRCKSIDGRKVSLSMVSTEDEQAVAAERRAAGASDSPMGEGAKDWKESLGKMQAVMPTYKNVPQIVDLRK